MSSSTAAAGPSSLSQVLARRNVTTDRPAECLAEPPVGSTWLNDNLSTWEKFLDNLKIKYDIISDNTVETGKHFKYKLIVLPGTKSISSEEALQLKKYLEQGGSVFATGGIGTYSDDGKWRGWEFLNQVFGIEFSYELKPNEFSKIHTVCGSLPITANIPTGFPLKVATWDRPMAVEVLDPRTTQVSFWYNYRLDDGLVREEIKKSAGIAFGNYGKGRFMWMGFQEIRQSNQLSLTICSFSRREKELIFQIMALASADLSWD